jgi:23S rRNA pseudouridine2604 synthase
MGRYRDLTDAEIKELNELIEPSSKTEEASLPRTETPKREQNSSKKTTPGSRKKEIIKFHPLSFVSKKNPCRHLVN